MRVQVVEGQGKARQFTQLEWVSRAIQSRFGFVPFPGTLNLHGPVPLDAEHMQSAGVRIESGRVGECGARCLGVRLNGAVRAVWLVPDVPGYPADQIELIAGCSLRMALGLRTGDWVDVEVEGDA